MKLRDLQGRIFQTGLIGNVPTGNLLWVDKVHGNDALAVRERMTVPFQTLGAAKSAASSASKDTIIVLPGIYNENDLAKDAVNWHFLNGAIVDRSDGESGDKAIFDTTGLSNPSFVVSGEGKFMVSNSINTSHVVYNNGSGEVILSARELRATDAHVIRNTGTGRCVINVLEGIYCATGDGIVMEGGTCLIRCHNLATSGSNALRVSGGAQIFVHAFDIYAATGHAITITGGTGPIVVEAYEIRSGAGAGVYYNNSGYTPPTLLIKGARIKSTWVNSAGYAVHIASNSTNAVRLSNCTLIAEPTTPSYALYSATTPINVHIPGGVAANKGTNVSSPLGGQYYQSTAIT